MAVCGATADFLAPSLPDFAEELAAVRATPLDRVISELAVVPGLPESAARPWGRPGAPAP